MEVDIRPKMTRREAIRRHCFECNNFAKIARDCPDQACPLWSFRMGAGQEETDVPLRPDHYRKFQSRTKAKVMGTASPKPPKIKGSKSVSGSKPKTGTRT